MTPDHPVDQLASCARTFGRDAADAKLRLLGDIAAGKLRSPRRLTLLGDTLVFLRAYPDNERVYDAVLSAIVTLRENVEQRSADDPRDNAFLNTGLPGSSNSYWYSYPVLQRLVELFPGRITLAWEEIAEIPPRVDALNLVVLPSEARGLEDEYMTLEEWLGDCALNESETGLEVVLRLFGASHFTPREQMHLFETAGFPAVFPLTSPGSARVECVVHPERPFFQQRPLPRERFRLAPRIVKAPQQLHRLSPLEGRAMLDLGLTALCSRNLEIHALMYASDEDVTVVEGERGLQVVLAGMKPEFRQTIESDFYFHVLKNGVPIAYGPASVFLACCEMGINLHHEFRGAEIRYVYTLLMRALYHVLGVRYFFLTSYGMGELNPEALRSGAFWFYRKLGFRALQPDVESMAREEEKIMRSDPGYRSSLATLRKLSHTDAYFDLTGGRIEPLNFEALGLSVSEFVTREFSGDRGRAERECVRLLSVALPFDDLPSWSAAEKTALRRLAPILVPLPGLVKWPTAQKVQLAKAIKAKAGLSEATYLELISGLPRLAKGLQDLASLIR